MPREIDPVEAIPPRAVAASGQTSGPDGDKSPISLWERVQAIRAERATVGSRSTRERVYVPRLFCHSCGAALFGHASAGHRRMTHPLPQCQGWTDAAGRRTSFRAEIYEWQISALMATARLDDVTKTRILAALGGEEPPIDQRRISRLESDLRGLALDNAFGRVPDDDYLRRKAELGRMLEEARRPAQGTPAVDPRRALGYLEDLRSAWDVELPLALEHATVRDEYERRRAEATAAAFERLEALGPLIVEVQLAQDPARAAPLALSLQPERAELTGERADVLRRLIDGRRSRLSWADTAEARKKRRQRHGGGTLRCIGRGERTRPDKPETVEGCRAMRRPRRRPCRDALDPRLAPRYMTGNVSDTRTVAPPARTGQPFANATALSRSPALRIE